MVRRGRKYKGADIMPWLEALSYIAAVVALALIVVQMRAEARTQRAQQALEFLRQFNSEPMNSYRLNALKPWQAIEAQIGLANERGGLSRGEVDALARSLIREYDRSHPEAGASLAIREVVSFYDQLKVCAEERVCEERILRAYFTDFARNFRCAYMAVIVDQKRAASATYGSGLEWFAGTAKCQ